VDPTREFRERDEILDRIRPYVDERGVANLTMEALADWLGMRPNALREFFETKEELVVELVARSRIRLRTRFATIDSDPSMTDANFGRAMWRFYVDTASDSKLFFEAYGLALHDEHYGEFLHGVNDWLDLLADALTRRGLEAQQAAILATLTLSVFRGAMLDYCATGDRERLDAAMELWFVTAERMIRK
jgi:AcrR family transcriptional regulator